MSLKRIEVSEKLMKLNYSGSTIHMTEVSTKRRNRRYKTPSPQLLRMRRSAANERERRRMDTLNNAYEKVSNSHKFIFDIQYSLSDLNVFVSPPHPSCSLLSYRFHLQGLSPSPLSFQTSCRYAGSKPATARMLPDFSLENALISSPNFMFVLQ